MAQNLQDQLADDVRLPDVAQRAAADVFVQQPDDLAKARVIGHCASSMAGRLASRGQARSNPDPFHLVEADVVLPAVIEPRCARAGVV